MNAATFLADVAQHKMEVFRDDGVYRHVRFREPGTMCMHFDLITWPGYLCYTGDMGTYVFTRIQDMFRFFRPDPHSRYEPMQAIDFRYWAEKVQGADRNDGLREFDEAAFRREITQQRRRLLVEKTRGWTTDDRRDLWDSLEDVKNAADDGEHRAFAAVWDWAFDFGGRSIHLSTDDFPSCKTYTHRFLWCCYALRWGVLRYDEAHSMAQPSHASGASGSPASFQRPDEQDRTPFPFQNSMEKTTP